ncbi:AMP-binding protein [Mycobacterium sp. SWH-M5]|uniref:AMP-binding protein n=1 Tax=Mycolicibacterium goodii TaxID=134601 RepID=A0ABS6HUG9_MYCGD|nr:AMP-binding protein [Mycolicibacterium goodii]MBU8826334.1 AMP-binding protein [Mycolicibacterium goodii]MBU8839707.1 AMP-binding protein [Mycolicibacterium goodii]OKH72972.1 AMP-binding protein [Mycobacterium sp. SWH-M5]
MGENSAMTPSGARKCHSVPVLSALTAFEAVDRTFPQMLCDRERSEPDTVAYQSWSGGTIRPTTWRDHLDEVRAIALALHRSGIATGERVAILAGPRPEWVVAALAILSIGGIPVGVHQTSSRPEIRHVLENSGATAIFVETTDDAVNVAALSAELDQLRLAIGLDACPTGLAGGVDVQTWQQLRADGRRLAAADPTLFEKLVEAGDVDQPAGLFYTSGSTGAPKGVTHTHRTIQYSVLGFAMSYPDLGRTRHDLVGFLGLSHVAPALIAVYTPIMTRLVITHCSIEERLAALIGVRPTAVLWPPRMHEKLAAEVLQALSGSGRVFRFGYRLAMTVARPVSALRWQQRELPWYLRAADAVARRMVFVPLLAKVGMDRIQVTWTASGSMTPDVAALWHTWGLDLRELFGTTETCGSVLAQWDRSFPAPGTIGKSLPDPRWELRVSAQGELQLRSPTMFVGYWENPEATAAAMSDGWYRTGDLVELAPDGEVKIIGRLKDVLKTSGGKMVSPQPIETRLKASPLIDEAIVVGDGRKYLSVLLSMSQEAKNLPPGDRDAAVSAWLNEVNAEFSRPYQLKKYRILPRELSVEAGELTAKGTIRRAAVLAAFGDLIDDMYDAGDLDAIAREARYAGPNPKR